MRFYACKKLHDLTKVKLKTAGNTSVVQFTAGNNKTCTVRNLSKDTYLDTRTVNLWSVYVYSSTPAGYTWHHVEDGRTMLLVPSDLHSAVRHTGGASLIRKGIRP